MLSSILQHSLEAFAAEAGQTLQLQVAGGSEIPFELVQTGRGRGPALYCYRPLIRDFIARHHDALRRLDSHEAAVRTLSQQGAIEQYLTQHGERRLPAAGRARAELALLLFLGRVFADCSRLEVQPGRLERALAELERTLLEGRCETVVVTPLLGLELDEATRELVLSEELMLVRGEVLAEAPPEATWADGDAPNLLVVLRVQDERDRPPAIAQARARVRRLLTALRLYESGGFCAGPLAWVRQDAGPWRAVPLGGGGRPGMPVRVGRDQEDELRGFCNLVARRAPSAGEAAWALARFEMGCERPAPLEALTDHLLAMRALLEPEGPESGRLAQRLAVICAAPDERAALAERTARAVELERAAIAGRSLSGAGVTELVEEMADHLRAILRDVVCGHLSADLCALADEILAEAVSTS